MLRLRLQLRFDWEETSMRSDSVKRSRLAVLVLVLIATSLLAGACSSTRTTGEQVDDGWITTKIKAKLAGDGDINPFNIDVDVLDGVVTLSGKVKKVDTKQEAERLARDTKGVKNVVNKIEVDTSS
jgi:hyperosmotically inducible periplasmic protein